MKVPQDCRSPFADRIKHLISVFPVFSRASLTPEEVVEIDATGAALQVLDVANTIMPIHRPEWSCVMLAHRPPPFCSFLTRRLVIDHSVACILMRPD